MTQPFRTYLHSRGITDEAIERYGISGTDDKVIIPVQGFNKYRTFPTKRYFYDKGFKAALFGLQQLGGSKWCVLTEGELDALRLASEGLPAVSGTGGAGTFKDEWVSQLPEFVFICYDTDEAGKSNARKVHWAIPKSRIVELPEGKDVTEYMATHTKEDFEELIKQATVEPKPPPVVTFRRAQSRIPKGKNVPITNFIKFTNSKAKCIWHKDDTPSLHYYPKTNTVYCFGCDKSADVISVVMQLHGLSFTEAVKKLI